MPACTRVSRDIIYSTRTNSSTHTQTRERALLCSRTLVFRLHLDYAVRKPRLYNVTRWENRSNWGRGTQPTNLAQTHSNSKGTRYGYYCRRTECYQVPPETITDIGMRCYSSSCTNLGHESTMFRLRRRKVRASNAETRCERCVLLARRARDRTPQHLRLY